jgi:hypothetical protein
MGQFGLVSPRRRARVYYGDRRSRSPGRTRSSSIGIGYETPQLTNMETPMTEFDPAELTILGTEVAESAANW